MKRQAASCPECGREIGVHVLPQHRATHFAPTALLHATPDEQAEIIRLYRRGLTIRQISAQVLASQTAVRTVLVRNGEPRRQQGSRKTKLSIEENLRTSELYGAGLSMAEVALLLGLNVATVHRRLHRFGSVTRPVGGRHPGQPRPLHVLQEIERGLNHPEVHA